MVFPEFSDVFAAIEDVKRRQIIEDYAIFGAVAQLFWDEAIPTFDLDVLVLLPVTDRIDLLRPLYDWAAARAYTVDKEHIEIGGVPVQFVPVFSPLTEEAVRAARSVDYKGMWLRVVGPEYLIAIWSTPPANSDLRKERAARLREFAQVDERLLADLSKRYDFSLEP